MPVNGFDPLVNLSSSSMATHPHCSSSPPSSSSANATSHSVATSHHQNGQTVDMECTSTASEQMMDSELTVDFSNHLSLSPRESDRADRADRDLQEMTMSILAFEQWTQGRQTEFVEQLIHRMSFHQHEQLYSILMPLLQRDFITALPNKGLHHVAYKILTYLDSQSLCRAEQVCSDWYRVIAEGMLWKKLIAWKVRTDLVWNGLSERRGWGRYLNNQCTPPEGITNQYFRRLYPCIIRDIQNMEANWRSGKHALTKIECRSENSKGVYCLQYDDEKIVSGLRDNTIKIWQRDDHRCVKVLHGHTGSVLCLQYDDRVIITGSSDSTIRVWDVVSGQMINTLVHHCEAVLHLRFNSVTMVTCSKDRTIAVWDMKSPSDIALRRVLVGHRAAVNVVDFDERYIVSASGDRTIKVWRTSTSEFVRTLHGHRRGIACLQYRGNHVVSGSSDNSIRIWDVECGACLRLLEGHEELVRCIRFDDKRIVSGAYDGTIKVWDLQAALDPRTPANTLCLKTLTKHEGRVFRLQFDDFQIVSSSHDDTILIWDFLDSNPPDVMEVDGRLSRPFSPEEGSESTLNRAMWDHHADSDTIDELEDKDIPYPIQETQAQVPGLPLSPPFGINHSDSSEGPAGDRTFSPS